ncbi:MAG: BRCT domain-containing protein [Sandaracinus sp.]|nr:BRCT domain-containing protein [Sandaracinus sp.]
MDRRLRIEDLERARAAFDPDLADLVVALAAQPDLPLRPKPRDDAPTVERYFLRTSSRAFQKKKAEERRHERVMGMQALEAPDAEVPLPERMRLYELLLSLWRDGGGYERDTLLRVIADVPLRWGPWRALKQIFKEAEEAGDTEMLGALAARFDANLAKPGAVRHEIRRPTFGYLVRRAWRFLRRQAETLPAVYADAAVDVLRFYPDDTDWTRTWIANHIFFHETKKYRRRTFRVDRRHSNLLTHRAYPELWRRTPRPLFTLLERARSDRARAFAAAALKTDFAATLREVEPAWVVRLVGVRSAAVDDFVIWVLANVPRFEQDAFRELGLHDAVLALLDSPSSDARVYASAYARTHARDLSLDELVRLANNSHVEVRKLARDLLQDRDPRKDVGLEGWGRLLGTTHAHELATAALRKHFGARELTPEWFRERILSPSDAVFRFATELLPTVHKPNALGAAYFRAFLDDPRLRPASAAFVLDALGRLPLTEDAEGLELVRRALVHPLATRTATQWIEQERVVPKDLGDAYLKTLAFHVTWESSPWVEELKGSGREWARDLRFDERLSSFALRLLNDVRKFSPTDLGFEWLMQLAARGEPRYQEFARDYMIKAFLPADFAPQDAAPTPAAKSDEPATIDLGGQSFLFTGKLATMQRGAATKKVTGAGGKNASGVTATLDYLVIGDDGSPLYGAGRKGSKQLKAEKLIADGAGIKIISETAFLQMLAGEQRSFSEDTVTAGCDRLWTLATEPGADDAPLRSFALAYLRRHHPDISLAETDRPVDPGAEIPESYLSFERVRPLLSDARPAVRSFGLDLARYELARWAPPIEAIVGLCESEHGDVRAFVEKALLADDGKEHARYRIDPATLTTDAVYSFCESLDAGTRALGMQLIAKNPRLAVPEELFRLTESPDRQVRALVVRTLWKLFRDRGTTNGWVPAPPPSSILTKKKGAPEPERELPEPRHTTRPASDDALVAFFRRILFTIPPARPPLERGGKKKKRLRPLPSRRAKLELIQVMRDLAVEDAAFAGVISPVLEEFMGSRGRSEHAACLVALTRIRHAAGGAS